MAWAVDMSILLDIYLADPAFGRSSAACLARCSGEGLLLCPVTYVELAPAFAGNVTLQRSFLQEVGVEWAVPWTMDDTYAAHRLWHDHVTRKRAGHAGKRPVADVLIEAFAQRFQGLITRNPKHFTTVQVLTP
ncbi:MAG TPA: hypothetical protein VGD78_09570 [Chthoniobacterales bacterium]